MNAMRLSLWAVAAVAAVGVTTAAVTVANANSGEGEVLSQDEVARQLADQTATPATPDGVPSPTPTSPQPTGDGESSTLRSQAGQLVARCDGDTVYLETWTPDPGYRVDDVARGPSATAWVEFESDSHDDVDVAVRCEAGAPTLTEFVEPDDHGGDRDDDDDYDDDYDDRHDDDDDNSGHG